MNTKRLVFVLLLLVILPCSLLGQKRAKTNAYYAALTMDSVTRQLLIQANAMSFCKDDRLKINDYEKLAAHLVSYYENNGYPFVEVRLDSLNMQQDFATARLTVDRHEFIVFDSIIVQGSAKIRPCYLYPYLSWREGKRYRESVVSQIPSKIAEMPFVTEIQSANIEFVNDKCYLYLYLDKRKTNQFDGFLGLVPVDERTGKVSLNGEVNLALNNVFKIGESLSLQWRSTERYSQFLQLQLDFPFLFRTPLGVNGNFILDKKDTSYLTMNYELGLKYSFRGHNYARLYFDYASSNVLNSNLLVADTSSNFIDYRKMLYGLEFAFQKLDYIYNPRKGFSLLLSGGVGQRKIVKNAGVEEVFYENLDMHQTNYRLVAELNGYIPLYKRFVFALGLNGGTLFGGNHYMNEMFRIGGMNSLQGFDEKAIYCSSYVIANAEVRFLFARRSYITAFFNGAWYERNVKDNYVRDWPFGFGLGLSFDTKAGLFYLSYALGKQFDNPISFKTGKIHFGVKIGF